VHFAPDETGTWEYLVDFRKGRFSAVSETKETGEPGGFMDGFTGTFEIEKTDKTGRDLRGKGLLKYVGERYLKFAETGEYFLKVGPDAPENFLAYADFDGTFQNDGRKDDLVKTWEPHLKNWRDLVAVTSAHIQPCHLAIIEDNSYWHWKNFQDEVDAEVDWVKNS
jgi:hypothetical protein